MRPLRFLGRQTKAAIAGLAVGGIVGVGLLDYATGPRLSFSIFYLVPVSLGAWFIGRKVGLCLSVFAAATWLVAETASTNYSSNILFWNAAVRLGFFTIVSVLLASRKTFDDALEQTVRDRTEALRAEVELRRRAEEEIRHKNRDLQTLLYVSSHDLREPLRAIQAFSHLINERYAGQIDEKGRDFLRRIIRGGERMERLINDLAVLSRAQQLVNPQDRVGGKTLVMEALKQLRSSIEATGAKVKVAEEFPELCADKVWAVQAVYNLIANALKFTREGEVPDIEVAPYQADGLEPKEGGIVVRDRGPGVKPEQAERIFELFQRAVSREVEGTGAGLAIVRLIAERHGGRTWVRPREGGGSEFFVTFGSAPTEERE